MSISKTKRHEIFRRDRFTCQYCGAKAPDVQLELDHVVPETLGGTDVTSNLVTACRDCNSGKGKTHPDSPTVDDVTAADLKWGRAMREVAEARRAQAQHRQAAMEYVGAYWVHKVKTEYRDHAWRDTGWEVSLGTFFDAGLDAADMKHFVDVAFSNKSRSDGALWKYFCGCCWTEIRTRQQMARDYLNAEDVVNSLEEPN